MYHHIHAIFVRILNKFCQGKTVFKNFRFFLFVIFFQRKKLIAHMKKHSRMRQNLKRKQKLKFNKSASKLNFDNIKIEIAETSSMNDVVDTIVKPIDCVICLVQHSNLDEMKQHFIVEHCHDMDAYAFMLETTCNVCHDIFDSDQELIKHQFEHKDKMNDIINVKQRFDEVKFDEQRIDEQIYDEQKPNQRKLIDCVICLTQFTNLNLMKQHFYETHNDEMEAFMFMIDTTCNICHDIFDSLEDLAKHTHSEHVTTFYSCKECTKRFRSLKVLNRHIVRLGHNTRPF